MRDYSSPAAIIDALESEPTQCLYETLAELEAQDQILLSKSSKFVKSAEFHLRDLKSVLPIFLGASAAVINTSECIVLAARMRGITKFKTPTKAELAQPELLAYLQGQLASIEVNSRTRRQLDQRSSSLLAREAKFRRSRARPLANLCF
jgi:hypothetical protein